MRAVARPLLAGVYALAILGTLGMVRQPLDALRRAGLLVPSLALLGLVASGLAVGWAWRPRENRDARLLGLLGTAMLYLAVLPFTVTPEERLHLPEYGLLGIMIYHALPRAGGNQGRRLLWAAALGTFVGFLDEVIQGILPSRVGDVRDVLLNALAVLLGLLVLRVATAGTGDAAGSAAPRHPGGDGRQPHSPQPARHGDQVGGSPEDRHRSFSA